MNLKQKIISIVCIFLIILGILCYNNIANAENALGNYRVTANIGLRLRDKPVDGNILTAMPKGTIINITAWDGNWGYGVYNNIGGWCYNYYLTPVKESSVNSDSSSNMTYLGTFKITGYTSSPKENGGYTVTCKGVSLKSVIGKCVAVDKRKIALGTNLYIEGIGYRTAMDTGVVGNVIDVLCSTSKECNNITGYRKVYIVK